MILMFSDVLNSTSHSLSRGGSYRNPREKRGQKSRKNTPPKPPAIYLSTLYYLGPCTEEERREAIRFMTLTYTPWPVGSTPESVAASIRRLRATGILPEREIR